MKVIDLSLLQKFEAEQLQVKKKLEAKAQVFNSGNKPKGAWTQRIVDKIKISELAGERGITKCPKCDYGLSFDDSRGWFICINAKYNLACDFKGGIVKFTEWLMEAGLW